MTILLPSSAQTSIEILELEYPTKTTITAPTSAPKGTSFPISGKLTFREGGIDYGLENRTLAFTYNGTSLGTVTTGTGGNYSKSVTINEVGSFTLTARFAGETGFSASEAKIGLSIGLLTPLTIIVSIILPITVGLAAALLPGRR